MVPRKVAYLTPLYFDESSCLGGGERYPLNLARGVHLASDGRCRVDLFSFGQTAKTLDLAEGVGLRVLPMAHKPQNPLDVVSWELPEAIAEYDLVHIHQAYTRCAEMGVLVAKQMGKPVFLTDHGGESSPLGREVGLLDLVDRIVAYSEFGAARFGKSRRVEIIKGGVDCRQFKPPTVRPKRDRFLFVGRLLPHKGIDILIEALPAGLKLTVCGRPYRAEYFETLKNLAIGKDVEFLIDADDGAIRDLYARAWATVLPSTYRDRDGVTYDSPELMGFTILESMSCGTPAIASRVGAMPEFILEGETGFVFDSPAELTTILRGLATDPELVETIGERALHEVRSQFDLTIAGAKLLRLYSDVFTARCEVAA